jgi:DNA-binding NtrC family response regulator
MEAAKPAVLVVDDEEKLCRFLARELSRRGYRAYTAHEREGALTLLAREAVDVVLLDIALPGASGVEILEEVRRTLPRLQVVMLTGTATVETAVRAMKLGAFDYLTKPYDLGQLTTLIDLAFARTREAAEAAARKRAEAERLGAAVRTALGADPAPVAEGGSLAELEKAHILKVLAEQGGNRTAAARVLGVDVKTLYNKLKEYRA